MMNEPKNEPELNQSLKSKDKISTESKAKSSSTNSKLAYDQQRPA